MKAKSHRQMHYSTKSVYVTSVSNENGTYKADNNGDFCRHVSRRILGPERLRADDIADTVSNKIHCCNCSLLRITGLKYAVSLVSYRIQPDSMYFNLQSCLRSMTARPQTT